MASKILLAQLKAGPPVLWRDAGFETPRTSS